jgi:tetratricopeptide (TPR) repeat protein
MNQNTSKSSFGSLLKQLREGRNLELPDLATAQFPEEYFSQVEAGTRNPSLDCLKYLAERLGVPLSQLLADPTIPATLSQVRQWKEQLLDAYLALQTRDFAKALNFLVQIIPEKLPVRMKARYYYILGEAKAELRQYEEARDILTTALDLYNRLKRPPILDLERVRNWLGIVLYNLGSQLEAIKLHYECLDAVIQGKIKNPRFEMNLYGNLGNELNLIGRYTPALEMYQKALTLTDSFEDKASRASILWGMALIYRDQKNLTRSLTFFRSSSILYEELNQKGRATTVKGQLAMVLVDIGDFEEAEQLFEANLKEALALNDTEALINNYLNLGYLFERKAHWAEATDWWEKAADLARSFNSKVLLGQALANLGLAYQKNAQPEKATELLEEAVLVLEQTDNKILLHRACEKCAEHLVAQNDLAKAVIYFKKAMEYKVVEE